MAVVRQQHINHRASESESQRDVRVHLVQSYFKKGNLGRKRLRDLCKIKEPMSGFQVLQILLQKQPPSAGVRYTRGLRWIQQCDLGVQGSTCFSKFLLECRTVKSAFLSFPEMKNRTCDNYSNMHRKYLQATWLLYIFF